MMNGNLNLNSFLPVSVAGLLAEKGREYDIIDGSVLFADVAGFTPLTEALLVLGREGSEELTRILNSHFSSMIEITESYGGDVLRFAGDAMTVLFPGDAGEDAVSCALSMLEKMKETSIVETRAGRFELAMKIGCSRGKVQIGIVGPRGEFDYYAFGEPLDGSADAEHHAAKGDLVVSRSILVPPRFEKSDRGEGFSLVTGSPSAPSPRAGKDVIREWPDLEAILPDYLVAQSREGVRGEHRGTSVIFLSFPSPCGSPEIAHRGLCSLYGAMASTVRKYGGVFNKIDFGDKGAKAVILFGAPLACENKEEMAVRAGLEILNSLENRGSVKMGITTSHLFSGPLGSSTRREFTVMGDGINLSARLMGYSKPGEIITDEATFLGSRDSIDFKDRGEISVKGKTGLIKIYQPSEIKEKASGETAKKLYGMESIQEKLKEWLLSEDRSPTIVLGDIGSGKTAAADWIFREASLREFRVQRVDLQPFSREMFFSLFSRLFKKIFAIESKEDLSKVLRFIPPVSREFASLLLPYFGFEEEREGAFEKLGPKDRRDIAYSMLLALLENIEDTVLIIDNLSFADEASLDFLSYAISNREKKLLDVLAFSRRNVAESDAFGIFKSVLELPALEKTHTVELLKDEYRIRSLSESFINFLLDKSKGNPRLIGALMTSIRDERLLFEKDGAFYVDEDRLFRTQFPDSLEAVYLKELDKLPAGHKQLLFEASVLGTNVSLNLLRKLSSLGKEEIGVTIHDLAAKGFCRLDDSGKRPYFVFSDTLLYEAVYNLAPFSLKRNLHGEVFRFLAEMEGDQKPTLFPYLAYHAEKADDRENAVKFHRLAGRYFVERSDNVSALKHLDFVMSRANRDHEYFEDSFNLLNIYSDLGKLQDSQKLLDAMSDLQNLMSSEHISRLLNHESFRNIREGDVAGAEKNLLRALAMAENAGSHKEIARSLLNLVGTVYGPSGRFDDGKRALDKLLNLPRFDGDVVFRVVALMNLGSIVRHQNDFASAFQYYRRSLDHSKKGMLLPRQTAIIANIVQLSYEANLYDKALSYSRRCIELASTFAQRDLHLDATIHYALALWSKGETTSAIQTVSGSIEKAKLFDKPYHLANGHVVLSVSQFEELMFSSSLNNLCLSIKEFEDLSCKFEAYSSKLEFLRALKILGDEKKFHSTADSWGGKEKIMEESRALSLPQQLLSVLDPFDMDPSADPDSVFTFWLQEQKVDSLNAWRNDLLAKDKMLRFDLKVKWAWAYLSKGLEPPFDPLRLLSRSPGGIYGLRIMAILWRRNVESGNRRTALKIRKNLLDRLYFAKIHSDDRVWECVTKDKDIAAAIIGRVG